MTSSTGTVTIQPGNNDVQRDEYGIEKPKEMLPTAQAGARLGGITGAVASFGGLMLDEFTPFGADGVHVPGMLSDFYEAGEQHHYNQERNEAKKAQEAKQARDANAQWLADQTTDPNGHSQMPQTSDPSFGTQPVLTPDPQPQCVPSDPQYSTQNPYYTQ
jgi:hypothetical protein